MSTEQKQKVSYAVEGDKITRTPLGGAPVVIGTLANGVATLTPEWASYKQTVKRMLNASGIEATVTAEAPAIVVPPAPVTTTGPVVPVAPVVVQAAPANPMAGLTIDQRKAINFLRSKEGFDIMEIESPAPSAPKMLSGHGDKTPAYVTWLLRYFPATFATTYGVIGMGSVERVRVQADPATGEKRKVRFREPGHVIARRATIYTDKQDSADDLESEGDL